MLIFYLIFFLNEANLLGHSLPYQKDIPLFLDMFKASLMGPEHPELVTGIPGHRG